MICVFCSATQETDSNKRFYLSKVPSYASLEIAICDCCIENLHSELMKTIAAETAAVKNNDLLAAIRAAKPCQVEVTQQLEETPCQKLKLGTRPTIQEAELVALIGPLNPRLYSDSINKAAFRNFYLTIKSLFCEILGYDLPEISDRKFAESTLAELGCDSLDLIEFTMAIEDEIEIEIDDDLGERYGALQIGVWLVTLFEHRYNV